MARKFIDAFRRPDRLEDPDRRRLEAAALAKKLQAQGITSPFIEKIASLAPPKRPVAPPPEPSKFAKFIEPGVAPITRGLGAFEAIGKAAGITLTAPFTPRIREKFQPKDVPFLATFLEPPVAPFKQEEKEARYKELLGVYEEDVSGVVRFVAEEVPFIPLWLVGGGAARKLGQSAVQRAFAIHAGAAAKVARGTAVRNLPKLERTIYDTVQRLTGGGRKPLGELSEEAVLKEVYGSLKITVGESVKLAPKITIKEVVKELLPRIPAIAQKELRKLGYTADEMSKMTSKQAKDIVRGQKVAPTKGVLPKVKIDFQIDVADVTKGYKPFTVKVGDSVRLVGEHRDVGIVHKVLDIRVVPDIPTPQLLLTTKGGNRWATGPFAELSKGAKPPRKVPPAKVGSPSPTPPEPKALVKRLGDYLEEVQKFQAGITKERAALLGRKVPQLQKALLGQKGAKAHAAARKALAGKVEAVVPKPPRKFTKEDVDSLKEIIRTTNQLKPIEIDPFERFRVMNALGDLLSPKSLELGKRLPQPAALKGLQKVFGEELIRELVDQRKLGGRIWDASMAALGFPKAIRASWDLSMLLRQSGMILLDKPQWIPRTVKDQVKHIFSDKYSKGVHEAMHATRWEGVMNDAKLYRPDFWEVATKIAEREEVYVSRFADWIPGIKPSQRAFVVGLGKLRTDFFVHQSEQWLRMGVKATESDYFQLARAVNILMGRGDPKGLSEVMVGLGAVFFSPRFQAARLMTPQLLFNESPLVAKMSRRVIAKYFSFWMTMLGAVSVAGIPGVSTDLDPRSVNFGKLRVGNASYDLLAGFGSHVRFVARAIPSSPFSIVQFGKTKSTTGRIMPTDYQGLLFNMLRTKAAPGVTPFIDLATGKTFLGQDISEFTDFSTVGHIAETTFEWFLRYLSPIAVEGVVEGVREEGFIGGVKVLPDFIGTGSYLSDATAPLASEVRRVRQMGLDANKKFLELVEEGKDKKAAKLWEGSPALRHLEELGKYVSLINWVEKKEIPRIQEDETLTDDERQEQLDKQQEMITDAALEILAIVDEMPFELWVKQKAKQLNLPKPPE